MNDKFFVIQHEDRWKVVAPNGVVIAAHDERTAAETLATRLSLDPRAVQKLGALPPASSQAVLLENPPSMLVSALNPPANAPGTLVTIPVWQANTFYAQNSLALNNHFLYECNADHISGATFAADTSFWASLVASTGAGFAALGSDGKVGGPGGSTLSPLVMTEGLLWKSVKSSTYGATGNGATNDDAAFALWVNALNVSGGGHGFVPAGHYILTAAWPTITNSNVVIELSSGAILDWSGAATNTKFITAQGTEGSTVALTANAAEGSLSLSVGAGNEAGFAGSYLRIASTAIWDTGRTNTPIGEQALCTTTTSGVINLWTRTEIGPYNTADTAVASTITHNTGFTLRGGTITGGGSGKNHQPVFLDKCRDGEVENVMFKSCDAVAVTKLDCVNVIVSKSTFYDIDSLVTGTGYGVSWTNACLDCLVVDSYFKNAKHATTTAATAGKKGIPIRCGARDCSLWGNVNAGDGFDTHAVGLDIFYEFCKVYGASSQGINMECPRGRIIGCQVWYSAANGIAFHNESTQPTDYECRGNKVYSPQAGSNGTGIQYTQAATASAGQTVRQVAIDGNEVYNSAGIGILAETDGSYRVAGVTIRNNTVVSPVGHGIVAEFIDKGNITGNEVTGIPASHYGIELLSCTLTPVSGNTVDAASATSTVGIYANTSSANLPITGNILNGAATGIQLDNTSSNCTVTGNDPSGCTTPVLPGTGTGHLINNNQWGASPPLRANLVGSIGASPWVWQNLTNQRVAVAINGGTVSAIKYSRDNVNFFSTSTSGMPVVDPGDYLQVTYTVAPTTFETFPQR